MEGQNPQAASVTGATNTPPVEDILQGVDIDEMLGLKNQDVPEETGTDEDVLALLQNTQREVEKEGVQSEQNDPAVPNEQEAAKRKAKASKRFTDLVAQRKAAEEEIARLQRENAMLAASHKQPPQQPTTEQAPTKPTPENFTHGKEDVGYLEALVVYNEALSEFHARQIDARLTALQQRQEEHVNQRFAEQKQKEELLASGIASYADYAKLQDEYKYGIAQMFGVDVAYHLAHNSALQDSLRQLPSREEQLIALGELKGRLAARKTIKERIPGQPPITPVNSVGASSHKPLEEMSLAEHIAYRKKHGW